MQPSRFTSSGVAFVAVGGAAASHPAVAQPPADTLACPAPILGRPAPPPVRAGTYRLVLVPEAPADPAARVAGRLWLWPAARRDRSPRTGERPGTGRFARLAARGVAFTGATDAPLDRAGGVLRPGDPDHFPPPASWDPVYPGLVGRRDGRAEPWQLWVGGTNVRTPRWRMMTDGPGAILFVEGGDGGRGFAGTWGPIGRVGGRGAFCARYVGPAPRR